MRKWSKKSEPGCSERVIMKQDFLTYGLHISVVTQKGSKMVINFTSCDFVRGEQCPILHFQTGHTSQACNSQIHKGFNVNFKACWAYPGNSQAGTSLREVNPGFNFSI